LRTLTARKRGKEAGRLTEQIAIKKLSPRRRCKRRDNELKKEKNNTGKGRFGQPIGLKERGGGNAQRRSGREIKAGLYFTTEPTGGSRREEGEKTRGKRASKKQRREPSRSKNSP